MSEKAHVRSTRRAVMMATWATPGVIAVTSAPTMATSGTIDLALKGELSDIVYQGSTAKWTATYSVTNNGTATSTTGATVFVPAPTDSRVTATYSPVSGQWSATSTATGMTYIYSGTLGPAATETLPVITYSTTTPAQTFTVAASLTNGSGGDTTSGNNDFTGDVTTIGRPDLSLQTQSDSTYIPYPGGGPWKFWYYLGNSGAQTDGPVTLVIDKVPGVTMQPAAAPANAWFTVVEETGRFVITSTGPMGSNPPSGYPGAQTTFTMVFTNDSYNSLFIEFRAQLLPATFEANLANNTRTELWDVGV